MKFEKKSLIKITPEIARTHAHICGDGYVYINKVRRSKKSLMKHPRKNVIQNVWVIEYTNKSFKLLEEFNRDLRIAFNRKGQWKLQHYKVKVAAVKWILELLELKDTGTYNWFIPEFILKANKNIIAAWLRAFFDDEGTITNTGRIRIKSMNKYGLSHVKGLLSKFGIKASLKGPNCDNSYYLSIYKRYSPIFYRYIGFNHPEKKQKLDSMIWAWRDSNTRPLDL